ncbi:MAG: hypothetical protein AAF074_19610 [Pseudomonadota bacterium]
MELMADGLLIATALTAALYCIVLSRRLKRLSSTEEGLGGQIVALNGAVEETRAALAETAEKLEALKRQSNSASERVRREIAQARRQAEELEASRAGAAALLDKLYAIQPAAEAAAGPGFTAAPSLEEEYEVVSADGPPVPLTTTEQAGMAGPALEDESEGDGMVAEPDTALVGEPAGEAVELAGGPEQAPAVAEAPSADTAPGQGGEAAGGVLGRLRKTALLKVERMGL